MSQIKEGYKETEVGVIPESWEVITFGNKVDILRGGSPRPIEDYITQNVNGINWIKIGDVRPNDKYIRQTEERIIPEGKKHSREVHVGDFILSNSMSFGRPYILNIDGCIHDGWLTIQNYANDFDKDFLYYLLGSEEVFSQYVSMAAGSSVQNLNKEKVAHLILKLPTLPEQQKIAAALSDIDSLISSLEEQIQKKKNIKQGAMQQLLTGKRRLPGFAKSNKTKQTELGEIPEDWEVKIFSELFTIRTNNTFTRDEMNTTEGEYENVHYGDVLISYPEILDCEKFNIPYLNKGLKVNYSQWKVQDGDIIIADTAEDETVGKLVEVINVGNRKIVSGLHTFLCRQKTTLFSPKWLGYFMNYNWFHNQLLPYITGTKVSAISRVVMQNLKIIIPSKQEQEAIVKIFVDMDTEINELESKLSKYRELKTGMMQQLLTGKIRLV